MEWWGGLKSANRDLLQLFHALTGMDVFCTQFSDSFRFPVFTQWWLPPFAKFCLTEFFVVLIYERSSHRVSTRLFLQSSDLGPLTPSLAGESVPSPFGYVGGTHSLSGEGVGDPNSDEGTDTVVLLVFICTLWFKSFTWLCTLFLSGVSSCPRRVRLSMELSRDSSESLFSSSPACVEECGGGFRSKKLSCDAATSDAMALIALKCSSFPVIFEAFRGK